MAETNLRQATAKLNAEGWVSEKDLKIVEENGKKKITGSVTIQTSDKNFIKYNVNINEKTNGGADNKAFPGMLTVMEEYKSISQYGIDEADKVRVSGDLNPYHSATSDRDVLAYKSNFFNRVRNDDEFNPHAEFDVELFISGIVPEMDKEGSETGRILVKGWMPTYNGIEPLELVADEEIGSAIESTFEPGQTVRFYGEAINSRVVETKEIPMAIGKPKIDTKTSYKNELLIEGASEAYEEGVTPEKPYEAATIKAAIQVRKDDIEARKSKANNSSAQAAAKPSGASRGRAINW